MGDLQAWIPHPNCTIGDYKPPRSPSRPSNPHPSMIRAESWRQAEQATQDVIHSIQPTLLSEQRRRAVVEYVQNLVRGLIRTEVLSFGSVPLKTYLPDGDIDLTALGGPNSEDAFATEVCSVLEAEGQNQDVEFAVKDVQYIHAEVDRHIGKKNLFKRSIILTKAWCYYESRILGAHHGLISTYALETMVLYIFHLFHSSLDGPLAVLYRFLDYYSKFDWDNYCVSLHGPISIASLPELVAEAPENDGGDLLLSKEFLRNCVDVFSDPLKGSENNSRNFPQKYLNIVDPLKENNNLGRSVSKANFYRIRSAFAYGARKLGRILMPPAESIADEVGMFFMNTLDRHRSGERPDVHDGLPSCPDGTVSNHHGVGGEDTLILGTPNAYSDVILCKEMNKIKIPCLDENETSTQLHRHPSDHHHSDTSWHKCTMANGHVEGNFVSGINTENGIGIRPDSYEAESPTAGSNDGSTSSSWNAYQPEYSQPADCSSGIGSNGSLELNNPVDLTGDYDMHFRNLLYAQGCREYLVGALFLPTHRSSPSHYRNRYSWDDVRRQSMHTHMNANGMVPGPPFSPMGSGYMINPLISSPYSSEDMSKPRGIGTYFPNTNYWGGHKERQSAARGKNPVANPLPRPRNNGRADTHIQERGSQDPPSQGQLHISNGNGHGKPPPLLEAPKSPQTPSKGSSHHANGFSIPSDHSVEFGSFGPVQLGASMPGTGRRLDYAHGQGSGPVSPASTLQRHPTSSNPERLRRSYQLKNDDDFPPLTG